MKGRKFLAIAAAVIAFAIILCPTATFADELTDEPDETTEPVSEISEDTADNDEEPEPEIPELETPDAPKEAVETAEDAVAIPPSPTKETSLCGDEKKPTEPIDLESAFQKVCERLKRKNHAEVTDLNIPEKSGDDLNAFLSDFFEEDVTIASHKGIITDVWLEKGDAEKPSHEQKQRSKPVASTENNAAPAESEEVTKTADVSPVSTEDTAEPEHSSPAISNTTNDKAVLRLGASVLAILAGAAGAIAKGGVL